jgi:hypothetical protein
VLTQLRQKPVPVGFTGQRHFLPRVSPDTTENQSRPVSSCEIESETIIFVEYEDKSCSYQQPSGQHISIAMGGNFSRNNFSRSTGVPSFFLSETGEWNQQLRVVEHEGTVKDQINKLSPSKRMLARPTESLQAKLFSSCCRPSLFGLYRHTNQWYLCRIRSLDVDNTFTIVWEDGTLQIGTTKEELLRPATEELKATVERALEKTEYNILPTLWTQSSLPAAAKIDSSENSSSSNSDVAEDEITVWEAAKRGDMATSLRIIDQGDASANDVELVDDALGTQGRTPLYWACFIGHVELVRELLARGGIDYDGSAVI